MRCVGQVYPSPACFGHRLTKRVMASYCVTRNDAQIGGERGSQPQTKHIQPSPKPRDLLLLSRAPLPLCGDVFNALRRAASVSINEGRAPSVAVPVAAHRTCDDAPLHPIRCDSTPGPKLPWATAEAHCLAVLMRPDNRGASNTSTVYPSVLPIHACNSRQVPLCDQRLANTCR